jgi:hypothetical protein
MVKIATTQQKELLILSPFELPDVRLASETIRAGAFPALHLGRDPEKALRSLEELAAKTPQPFGVCIASGDMKDVAFPGQVSKVVLIWKSANTTDRSIRIRRGTIS